jgi:hypothetical protein
MLPLTKESYTKLLGQNQAGAYTGVQYNIFNNSNIKALFLKAQTGSNLVDTIFAQPDPYAYIALGTPYDNGGTVAYFPLTSSPTLFPLVDNIGFTMVDEDPGVSFETDMANELQITGKININPTGTFTSDGTTDEFVLLVDESTSEVVSYIKLNSHTDNTVMNNISEIVFTNNIVNTSNLYTTTQLMLSSGMVDFIQGNIALSSLQICILKDKESSNVLYTYSTMTSSTSIHELSTSNGGDRIKLISQGHPLSSFNVNRYFKSGSFYMSLTAGQTVIPSSPATQGFTPPYYALLYDVVTSKPLVLFSDDLGIVGQDNIFVKANETGFNDNILVMSPGS